MAITATQEADGVGICIQIIYCNVLIFYVGKLLKEVVWHYINAAWKFSSSQSLRLSSDQVTSLCNSQDRMLYYKTCLASSETVLKAILSHSKFLQSAILLQYVITAAGGPLVDD
jgi:hypothetical protein